MPRSRAIATAISAAAVASAKQKGIASSGSHAPTAAAVPVAVALGASLYERHVMLPGDGDAIDAAVSSPPEELAALALTEAMTRLSESQDVPDDVYAEAASVFSEAQYRAIAWAVTVMNGFNRLCVTSRKPLHQRTDSVIFDDDLVARLLLEGRDDRQQHLLECSGRQHFHLGRTGR